MSRFDLGALLPHQQGVGQLPAACSEGGIERGEGVIDQRQLPLQDVQLLVERGQADPGGFGLEKPAPHRVEILQVGRVDSGFGDGALPAQPLRPGNLLEKAKLLVLRPDPRFDR